MLSRNIASEKANELWNEVELYYAEPHRFYHNLNHIENVWHALGKHPGIVGDQSMLLSVIYHDVIYDPSRTDNEERSADLASKRLLEAGFPKEIIQQCYERIIATKSHRTADDLLTNLFLDADLSILGSSAQDYKQYYKNIRREYAIFPDDVYYPGRMKVLQHFLSSAAIFKTEAFFIQYEKSARKNLENELSEIQALQSYTPKKT